MEQIAAVSTLTSNLRRRQGALCSKLETINAILALLDSRSQVK
jgi:hypothetical protein